MPTPRHIGQVSAQGGQTATPAADRRPRPGAWIEATVASVVGNLSNRYEVDLSGAESFSAGRVPATLAVDAAVAFGDRVWVVNAGNEYLIVAQR